MDDYISRADAIEAVKSLPNTPNGYSDTYDKACIIGLLESLPSADADGEDLIIKGAKGIQDGLYNIKDGKLFKYKGKGGTVRTYPIVPSADAVHGEWKHTITWQPYCSNCEYVFGEDEEFSPFWKYCPMCGARMKGGAE